MASKNRLYPHLLPTEIEIWERWLAHNPQRFDTFQYDVHVGTIPQPLPQHSPSEARLRQALLRRRIDVVALKGLETTIIEIKPVIGFTALGQALAYPILYHLDHRDAPRPHTLLIGATLENNIIPALTAFGIPYEIV